MADEVTINSNVTMGLHPAHIDKLVEQHGDEVAQYVAPVRSFFDAAYNSISDLYAAKEKGRADRSQTEASVIIKVAGSAAKVEHQLIAKAESLLKTLTTQIDTLNQSLESPLSQMANRGAVASEIRQHLKSLPKGKQIGVIQQAITEGNAEVVGAVLGAPGMLSGISDDMRREFTREWNAKAQPAISKRIAALTAARDRVEQFAPQIQPQVQKALGCDWAQVNSLKNASSEFEKSLIINRFLPANGTEG